MQAENEPRAAFEAPLRALRAAATEQQRFAAAFALRRVVAYAAREMSAETFCRWEDELYSRIFSHHAALVHSSNMHEKLGGVVAIEALVSAPSAEPESKGIKFANVLSNTLKQSCVGDSASGAASVSESKRAFITKTAAALGRLARRGAANSSDHVEFEVGRALEWLQHPASSEEMMASSLSAGAPPARRLAACLVLRELARHAPTLFYARVRDFFERVWPALMDARAPDVREAAAAALGAALEILAQRPSAQHSHFYCAIYAKAHVQLSPHVDRRLPPASELARRISAGPRAPETPQPGDAQYPLLRSVFGRRRSSCSMGSEKDSGEAPPNAAAQFARAAADAVRSGRARAVPAHVAEAAAHGALLAVGALLRHAGNFMMPRFRETCEAALALREHRSRAIRRAVTDLLPRLAQYCPDAFSRAYLDGTTRHLLKMARHRTSGELRDAAYEAIGRLALAVKQHLVPALDELVSVLCEFGLGGSWAKSAGALSVDERRRRCVAVECVADVVEALRDRLAERHLDALLAALFAGGLCEPLIRTLAVITQALPAKRPSVRARLLDALTAVLSDRGPYVAPGDAKPKRRRGKDRAPKRAFDATPAADDDIVLLSLRTLGTFGMDGVCLLPLVRDCVAHYLEAPSADVRAAAVESCCRLLLPPQREAVAATGAQDHQRADDLDSDASASDGGDSDGGDGDGTPNKRAAKPATESAATNPAEAAAPGSWRRRILSKVTDLSGSDLSVPDATKGAEVEQSPAGRAWDSFSGPSAAVVDDVLRRLMRVALADADLAPRRAVMRCLREHRVFDAHLCRSAHVDALALLLHDDDVELQLATLALLGRLAERNPAAVLARVRAVLQRALEALRCTASDAASMERAARLAAAVLRAESPRARACARPLAAAVVRALPLGYRELRLGPDDGKVVKAGAAPGAAADGKKANVFAAGTAAADVPTRLACAALDALAECVLVLGADARAVVYTPRVLAPLFDALLDRSSSRKRELALRVVGRLASASGCVVAPYLEHASLLPRILAVLRESGGRHASTKASNGQPWSLCREALRALGLLGALDPYKFELIQRGLTRENRERAAALALASTRRAPHKAIAAAVDDRPGPSAPIDIPRNDAAPDAARDDAAAVQDGVGGALVGGAPGAGVLNTALSASAQLSEAPAEPPLLAPHLAALLEADEDDPASAAMYAQSCAVALPAVREDSADDTRDAMALINAGEQMDGAARGDDHETYYYTAVRRAAADAAGAAFAASADDVGGDDMPGVETDAAKKRAAAAKQSMQQSMLSPASGEEYYARVAIDALVRVLRDASLAAHHAAVTQALTFIFQSLGSRCVPFLGAIVPHLLDVARRCEPGLRESVLLQLAALASIVRHHLREYLPPIFELVVEYWSEHLEQVVPLVEEIASSASDENLVAPLVPRLLPLLVASLAPYKTGATAQPAVGDAHLAPAGAAAAAFDDELYPAAARPATAPAALAEPRLALVLRATMLLRENLGEHLYLLVPTLLKLAESLSPPLDGARGADAAAAELDAAASAQAGAPFAGDAPFAGGAPAAAAAAAKDGAAPAGKPAVGEASRPGFVGVPATGALWQARVVRCLRIICSRGALRQRRSLGAASARALCRLLERSRDVRSKQPSPGANALRGDVAAALDSVASQLGPELFAPYEELSLAAVSAGPRGPESRAARQWKRKAFQRAQRRDAGFFDDNYDDDAAAADADFAAAASDLDASKSGGPPRADECGFGDETPGGRRGAQGPLATPTTARRRDFSRTASMDTAVTELSAVAELSGFSTPRGRAPAWAGNAGVADGPKQRLHVNQPNLQRAWDVSQRLTADDWNDWLRRLSLELLRESPSAALRSCATVAHAYARLARQLFQPAFVSCWLELDDAYRDSLVRSLEAAFRSDELQQVAPDALQLLLELAEFMERDVDALPIDIRVLADLATKCRAYAKALHYKELEYRTPELARDRLAAAEALIAINRKLAQPEAALGVLHATRQRSSRRRLTRHRRCGQMRGDDEAEEEARAPRDGMASSSSMALLAEAAAAAMARDETSKQLASDGTSWGVSESWLGKLGSYDEALQLYRRRLDANASDVEACLGAMKCLDALGEWQEACSLLVAAWPRLQSRRGSEGNLMELSASQGEGAFGGVQNYSSASLAGMAAGLVSGRPSGAVSPRETRLLMKAATVGARAAWALGRWDEMRTFVDAMENDDASKPFYRAILALQRRHTAGASPDAFSAQGDAAGAPSWVSFAKHTDESAFDAALDLVDDARRLLQPGFAALVAESYKRAYGTMVTLQQLAELEEIVELRRVQAEVARGDEARRSSPDASEHRADLVARWRRRLAGCASDVATWQRVLNVRALVLRFDDDPETWLRYASLCRHSGNSALSESVLTRQLGFDPKRETMAGDALNDQRLVYAYAKHAWAAGKRLDALSRMNKLSVALGHAARVSAPPGAADDAGALRLRVRCLLRLGDWRFALREESPRRHNFSEAELAEPYEAATRLDAATYKGWHAWALVNYRQVQRIASDRRATLDARATREELRPRLVAAARGFVRAIALGRRRWAASVQQDLLNVLNLWFRFGRIPEVEAVLLDSSYDRPTSPATSPKSGGPSESDETPPRSDDDFGAPLDAWLGVLPQLIARIGIADASPRSALHRLLARLGARHPQALVYPLSLQLKSPRDDRRAAAAAILKAPRRVAPTLVEQALVVSDELVRVAILWHEKWHEGLEEASRLYFGDGDVEAMLEILRPLHAELEHGPTTLREAAFQQAFGRDLAEAARCLDDYERDARAPGRASAAPLAAQPEAGDAPAAAQPTKQQKADAALNQAWDLYYTVFRRVNKQLPQLTTLELRYVSPALLHARSLELAVPGTYRVDGTAARIAKFGASVHVITSKQRPRKLAMRGDDGKEYGFLLKGHEDLRQDERAMQLFGLANALLAKDRRTFGEYEHLLIQRYAVTPLSHNCGVVGWVPACDTLHALVRDFRDARKVVLNVEHRVMLGLAPDYDALTVAQKVEVFSAALSNTTGQDLSKVLWLKSRHSEQWLERRTHYSRSLAAMSMVGHILGLGDRHPSNLMLDRRTGKVLHIDFGDCFEVAMHRDKFPERVPFRLTRMLVNAMEVSGVEGTYRATCERVLRVLRDERDSLLSMLEAFIHDPLISWRLLGATAEPAAKDDDGAAPAGASPPLPKAPGAPSPALPTAPPPQSASHGSRHGGSQHGSQRPDSRSPASPALREEDEGPEDRSSEDESQHSDDDSDSDSDDDRDDDDDDDSDGDDAGDDSRESDDDDDATDDEESAAPAAAAARSMARSQRAQSHQSQQRAARSQRASQSSQRAPRPAPTSVSQRGSLHLKMQRLSASLIAQSARYSLHSAADRHGARGSAAGSGARHSRLDHRAARERVLVQALGPEGSGAPIDALNEKALAVILRVQDKLSGCDFGNRHALSVADQVDRLIKQATDVQNLCQSFVGWCPFW